MSITQQHSFSPKNQLTRKPKNTDSNTAVSNSFPPPSSPSPPPVHLHSASALKFPLPVSRHLSPGRASQGTDQGAMDEGGMASLEEGCTRKGGGSSGSWKRVVDLS